MHHSLRHLLSAHLIILRYDFGNSVGTLKRISQGQFYYIFFLSQLQLLDNFEDASGITQNATKSGKTMLFGTEMPVVIHVVNLHAM